MNMAASGSFHMTHIAFVRDRNTIADNYIRNNYVTPTPTVLFDGGVGSVMGGGTNMEPWYSPEVPAAGARAIPTELNLLTAIEWTGDYDAQIYSVRIHVAVSNNAPVNTAPTIPSTPTGLDDIKPDQAISLQTSSTDAEANLLYYMWDYGDGELSEWEGPFDGGAPATTNHGWADRGDYEVRVKAKDPFGEETDWSAPMSIRVNCCQGRVGDANNSGQEVPTIGDISILIDAKFVSGTCDGLVTCFDEADINRSAAGPADCGDITIGDISLLTDYLFITGPQNMELFECQ